MSCHVGLSENRVPLNPLVNHHFPYEKYHLGVCTIFRQSHVMSYSCKPAIKEYPVYALVTKPFRSGHLG